MNQVAYRSYFYRFYSSEVPSTLQFNVNIIGIKIELAIIIAVIKSMNKIIFHVGQFLRPSPSLAWVKIQFQHTR